MLYKFKSKASGDVIMLGPNGDQVMRIVGREPAAKGIFEVAAMDAALAALEAAVSADEADGGGNRAEDVAEPGSETAAGAVGLRRRVWPLVEMLKRARQAGEAVVWGV